MNDLGIFNPREVRRVVEELEQRISEKNQRINELGEENAELREKAETFEKLADSAQYRLSQYEDVKAIRFFANESLTKRNAELEAENVKLRAACEAALPLEELTWQALDKLHDKLFKEHAKIQGEIDAINQQLRAALEETK